jgi:hypothetical protein
MGTKEVKKGLVNRSSEAEQNRRTKKIRIKRLEDKKES